MMNGIVLSGLLMGLFGGAHCVAMCVGVVGVVCGGAGSCSPRRTGRERSRWLFAVLYNAGRIASYTVVGALLGSLGSLAGPDPRLDVIRYLLRAVAVLTMLAAGCHLLGLPSIFGGRLGWGASVWRRIAPIAKRLLPSRDDGKPTRSVHAFGLGLLWGFMPCGLLYGAFALAASADSPAVGAATMTAFGIGTVPVMLTMAALASGVGRFLARPRVRQVAGAIVVGLGLFSMVGLARQVGLGSPFDATARRHCCPGHAQ
jgi:sulfite exporter TauE/SafE